MNNTVRTYNIFTICFLSLLLISTVNMPRYSECQCFNFEHTEKGKTCCKYGSTTCNKSNDRHSKKECCSDQSEFIVYEFVYPELDLSEQGADFTYPTLNGLRFIVPLSVFINQLPFGELLKKIEICLYRDLIIFIQAFLL